MKTSIYQQKAKQKLAKKALQMYRQGLSTRDVAKLVKKSHTWVAQRVAILEGQKSG